MISTKSLFLSLALLATTNAFAINGGVTADESLYPSVVRVFAYDDDKLSDIDGFSGRCTGVIISDRAVLTAGHCLLTNSEFSKRSLAVMRYNEDGELQREITKNFISRFDPETILPDMYDPNGSSEGYVPGCYQSPVAMMRTDFTDMGVLIFPAGTFDRWANLAVSSPRAHEEVEFFGHGYRHNSFTNPMMLGDIDHVSPETFATAKAHVWPQMNEQRFGFVTKQGGQWADHGDSGGPVFYKGKLVGLMSTVGEFCETPFGEDYAIINTVSKVSSFLSELTPEELMELGL